MFASDTPPANASAACRAAGERAMVGWGVEGELVWAGGRRLEWYLDGHWMGAVTRLETTPRGSRAHLVDHRGAGSWFAGILPASGSPTEQRVLTAAFALARRAGIVHHIAADAGFIDKLRPSGATAPSPTADVAAHRFAQLYPGSPHLKLCEELATRLQAKRRMRAQRLSDAVRTDAPAPLNPLPPRERRGSAASSASVSSGSSSGSSIVKWFASKFGRKTSSAKTDDVEPMPEVLGWLPEDDAALRRFSNPSSDGSSSSDSDDAQFYSLRCSAPAARPTDPDATVTYPTTLEVGLCRYGRLELWINTEWHRAALEATACSGPDRVCFRPQRKEVTDAEVTSWNQVNRSACTVELPAGVGDLMPRIAALATLAVRAGVVSDLQLFHNVQHRINADSRPLVEVNPAGRTPDVGVLLEDIRLSRTVQHWPLPASPPPLPPTIMAPPAVEQDVPNPCVVCLTNARNCVFFPCRHLCACHECCEDLTFCPLCRTKISNRVEVWA